MLGRPKARKPAVIATCDCGREFRKKHPVSPNECPRCHRLTLRVQNRLQCARYYARTHAGRAARRTFCADGDVDSIFRSAARLPAVSVRAAGQAPQ